MNRATFIATFSLVVISFLQVGNAADGVAQLGNISYRGTACPPGSVSASITGNGAALQVSFAQYNVSAHGRNRSDDSLKGCALAIPVSVPAGWSIALESARYSGSLSLESNANTRITNEFTFSGTRGANFKTDFDGPSNRGYNVQDPLSSLASVWSPCGGNTTLRINTSMRIKGATNSDGLATNSSNSLVTALKYRRCQ